MPLRTDRTTSHRDQSKPSVGEAEIRALIERWSRAVREQDRAEIRRDRDTDILMFDVPPPFQSRGIEDYMATWEMFLSSLEKPVVFTFADVEVTAGTDVAFATAVGPCVNIDRAGQREPLKFRLTMGLRKRGDRWIVTPEHHSLPAV
jgi:ketosteroid isomerase-like protein